MYLHPLTHPCIYFEKLTFNTALSVLIAGGTKHWEGARRRLLSLLRLTGDKSFNAHQEILPAWQFLVSVDSNSEGEINFFHLCHPNVAGTAMIVSRRRLASCELVLLLIKLTLMPYWSCCYKLRLCEIGWLFLASFSASSHLPSIIIFTRTTS